MCESNPELLGILITMNWRFKDQPCIGTEYIKSLLGDQVFRVEMGFRDAYSEAVLARMPVSFHRPDSLDAAIMQNLAEEVNERFGTYSTIAA